MKIAEAAAWLQTCEQAIILIHQSPDGDCIGSGYALAALFRQMGKHAVVRCSDPIPARYAFLTQESEDTVDESVAAVISVDVADRKLLGDLDAVYGDRVQGLAHDVHAEQKQGKAAKQGKDIENGHKDFLTFDFRSYFHPQCTPPERRRSAYRKSILRVLMVLSCLRVYCCNVKSKIRGM